MLITIPITPPTESCAQGIGGSPLGRYVSPPIGFLDSAANQNGIDHQPQPLVATIDRTTAAARNGQPSWAMTGCG